MLVYPSSVLELLDEGRADVRGAILFQLGTGTYGFIKSLQPFTFGGNTYQPGGIIEVSELTGAVGTSAENFTISLASSSHDELTPEVLSTIEAEDYRDRRVTIYDIFFHPDTNEFLHAQAMRRGYVDTIDHVNDPDTGYTIVANCETRSLDYSRRNDRYRNNEDQARRAPGDLYFQHTAKRGREMIYWGRTRGFTPVNNVIAGRGFIAGVTNR